MYLNLGQVEELHGLLEYSASVAALDGAGCSAESLEAARNFVALYGLGRVRLVREGLTQQAEIRSLDRLEVRRFAVVLDNPAFDALRAAAVAACPGFAQPTA